MVLKRNFKNTILWIFLGVMLVVGFNNCAPSDHKKIDQELASRALSCESELTDYYKNTVYAYVNKTQNCKTCHNNEGRSPYKFASENIQTAYKTFSTLSVEQMSGNAVNPTHGANCPGAKTPGESCTGGEHQEPFNTLQFFWENRYSFIQSCNEKKYILPGYHLSPKIGQAMYFSKGTTETLVWNLSASSDQDPDGRKLIPMSFMVDVKVKYDSNDLPMGYQLTNPRASALVGESEFLVEGVYFFVNDQVAAELSTLSQASKLVRGLDPVNLISGTVDVNLDSISNLDKISFYIKTIEVRSRTDTPTVPANPTLVIAGGAATVNDVNPVSIAITNDTAARRWCLTTSTSKPTTNNCPGQTNVVNTFGGWRTTRPTSIATADFGSIAEGNMRIHVWVLNSDFQINATASYDDILIDRTAPTANSLVANISSDSQIVSVTFNNSADVASWCLKTFSSTELTPAVMANDSCWTSTKPSLVGMQNSGSNKLALFVKDAAGNSLATPLVVMVNNAFGKVNFNSSLALNSSANRAVITNRCMSCHVSSNSSVNGKMLIDLTDATTLHNSYTNGTTGAYDLRNSINTIFGLNNPYSADPAAHNGLTLSQHDRLMLWLWKTNLYKEQ